MKVNDLRKKSYIELEKQLVVFYRERFKFLLEKSSGAEFTKNHLLKKVRKSISRVLTLMTEFKKKNV